MWFIVIYVVWAPWAEHISFLLSQLETVQRQDESREFGDVLSLFFRQWIGFVGEILIGNLFFTIHLNRMFHYKPTILGNPHMFLPSNIGGFRCPCSQRNQSIRRKAADNKAPPLARKSPAQRCFGKDSAQICM